MNRIKARRYGIPHHRCSLPLQRYCGAVAPGVPSHLLVPSQTREAIEQIAGGNQIMI
jgi:hypothetical protein